MACPFANIAQGTNTVMATKMGMSLADYTVTEAGFGFDLGGEKFLDIKCQSADLKPKVVVLTATIRALKYHGGAHLKELTFENLEALRKGLPNLEKHLENVLKFNLKPVIAINKFKTDTEAEIKIIEDFAKENGYKVAIADVWAKGGEGAIDLAKAVTEVVEDNKTNFKPLYKWERPVEEKILTIAQEIYGASAVEYTAKAKKRFKNNYRFALG